MIHGFDQVTGHIMIVDGANDLDIRELAILGMEHGKIIYRQ